MATSSTSRTAKNVIIKNLAVFPSIFQTKYLPLVCQVPPLIFCHHSQKLYLTGIWWSFGYEILKKSFIWKNAITRLFFVRKLSTLWMTAAETEWRYLTSILQIFDLNYRKKEFLQRHLRTVLFEVVASP